MKLAMNYLGQIENIEITTILSFVFFFIFFLIILFHVLRTKSSYYESVSNFPSNDGILTENANNENNELKL
jgi:cbb3-type cytochrome oxidase subunit 3